MHHSRLLITGLLLSLIVGCAGSGEATVSYDAEQNITTYETNSYTVSSISAGNFASSKSISMRAVSKCRGQDCTPQSVQFVFTASGNQEVSLSGLDGKIIADDRQVLSWNSAEAGTETIRRGSGVSGQANIAAIGKFAAIDVQLPQVRQIATASSAKGSIGGLSLNFNSGIQSGLQSMLQKTAGQSKKNSSSPDQ